MHMISKKDDAEMDTLTKSCSPYDSHNRQWRSANAMKRQRCMSKELDIFLTMKVLEKQRQQCCRSESFAMKTGHSYEWINGQKPHLIKKTEFGLSAIRRTSFPLWYQVCQVHLLDRHRPQSVKSTSPTTENWLRKLLYLQHMNNNTSDEDKHDTNYINKNDTNTYTRKLHNQ